MCPRATPTWVRDLCHTVLGAELPAPLAAPAPPALALNLGLEAFPLSLSLCFRVVGGQALATSERPGTTPDPGCGRTSERTWAASCSLGPRVRACCVAGSCVTSHLCMLLATQRAVNNCLQRSPPPPPFTHHAAGSGRALSRTGPFPLPLLHALPTCAPYVASPRRGVMVC